MKNTVLNVLSSKLALVSFLLMGLFLLAPDKAQAQTQLTHLNAASEYVSAAIAISRLEAETSALKSEIELLTPGTFAYKSAIWKYDLFSTVLNYLYEGKTVVESIQLGLKIYGTDVYAEMPESLKKAYRIELNLILHN